MIYFNKDVETAPREQLAKLQHHKLQAMLSEIYGKNRFYTNKLKAIGFEPDDLKSLDNFSNLPFTTKSELNELNELNEAQIEGGFKYTNLTYPLTAYTRLHQTSGSTGKPLRVFDTTESWEWWGRCWGHVFAAASVTATDRIFCAFSFGPFIGFWAAVEGAKQVGALFVPGGGRSSIERLQMMIETECTVLCCTPTYALYLLEVARQNNIDPTHLNIHTTIHAGEPGANIPTTKAKIESGWTAKCYDHAGASEVGAYAFECQAQPNGIHILESEFIAEVLQPNTNKAVSPGESGELIITNLGRWGYPIIRYRTGDIVVANNTPCECGRTFLRLDGGILGRLDDMVTIRGVNVFPSAIESFINRYLEVNEFRITVDERKTMTELKIDLELIEGVNEQAIISALQQDIQHNLSLRTIIKTVPHNTLPRFELKAKRFIRF